MKKLLFLALIVMAGLQVWQKLEPKWALNPQFIGEPYINIYGRNSCSITQKMRRSLEANNLNYRYFSVDDESVAQNLHQRMNDSGLSTRRYNLPVVDVSGDLMIRPEPSQVLALWRNH
ncbi:MAG: hypothetical protein CL693_03360 [Cellvibrionaceae bacterium]|nr:hypothetical protein [Cellvibrionaceae bacterium]